MAPGMRRGGYRGPVGRIGGVGPIEGPNVIGRIRMIQRITALDSVSVPSSVGRSFQEILENKSWGTASVPLSDRFPRKVAERRPLPPTREELEEMLESSGDSPRSFLSRLAGVLKPGDSSDE
jgi:hypothetical protein